MFKITMKIATRLARCPLSGAPESDSNGLGSCIPAGNGCYRAINLGTLQPPCVWRLRSLDTGLHYFLRDWYPIPTIP